MILRHTTAETLEVALNKLEKIHKLCNSFAMFSLLGIYIRQILDEK